MAATETMLDGLGEMARLRADAETRAATAEARVKELEAALRGVVPDAEVVGRGVERGAACGRNYLAINGIVVAMEGDVCRDPGFGRCWRAEDFDEVERRFKAPLLAALDSAGGQPEAKPDVAELLEEHKRSLEVFERLKKWLDDTGLRTNVELVDASIKATRALIAKAEVTR